MTRVERQSCQKWADVAEQLEGMWLEPDRFRALWDAYLVSLAWEYRRKAVRRRQRGKCFNFSDCGGRIVDVHHWHYRNRFVEPMQDLAGVCRSCHDAYTAHQRAGFPENVGIPVLQEVWGLLANRLAVK